MKKPVSDEYAIAVRLVKRLDMSFLDLACILAKAKEDDRPMFRALLKLPGLDRRTAYCLVEIHKAFGSLTVDKSILAKIGWTKLHRLVKVVTQVNVDSMLALAQSHTDRQLKVMFAGKGIIQKTRVVQLYMTTTQHKAYKSALLKFGATKSSNGLSGQEEALLKIIAQVAKNE